MPSNRHAIKQWFLTISQVSAGEDAAKLLSLLREKATSFGDKILEYVVANEIHQDGGRHIHAYVKLANGVTLVKAPEYFHLLEHTADCQPTRSAQAVVKYCTKDGDYITNISEKVIRKKKTKVSYATLVSKTTKDAIKDGSISYIHAKSYEHARRLVTLTDSYEHNGVRGLWFHGPSGTGKSRAARHSVLIKGTRFIKQQTKWWCGYAGEPVVVLDDLDTDVLGHHLKIWGDRYAFNAEVKGSQVAARYHTFIVTSNYTIDELFEKQPKMIEPIKRRFKEVCFESSDSRFFQPNLYQTSGFNPPIQSEESRSAPTSPLGLHVSSDPPEPDSSESTSSQSDSIGSQESFE